jgi:hypothetical protein
VSRHGPKLLAALEGQAAASSQRGQLLPVAAVDQIVDVAGQVVEVTPVEELAGGRRQPVGV